MGRISVYDTLTAEHTNYNANGKLKDIFPEINFKHSLVLKAGNRIDENYEVQPDDVLYVRKVPGAVTTIAIVAVAVAVVAVGVGVGATVYANKKSEEARKEMEKAQRNAQNQAQQAQQLPFIRGAKNKNALGNPVQFVMGSVYNTPYNLTNGFYSIDGTDGVNSYYNAVFSAGYGAQKVTDILIGNETLVSDQSGISGEVDFDSQVYEGRAEVRQPGQDMTLTNCNYKVSSTYSGAELKHDYGQDAVPVTVQAASNAYKIQVCIAFSCLRSYDSENEVWTERTAVVRPYWSNDGGQSWNEFTFEGSTNNTFTKNSNKTIRFVATKNFTAQESYGKDILIKVVKETPKAESGTQEDCSLLWYQTFCYDAALSSANTLEPCYVVEDQLKDKITRVAYRIIANDSTENMLDELHILSQGLARTWSNNAWSQTKTPTRNVADWILEVLTTDIHEPSKFDDDEIYLPSFGTLHDYCATNEFYCDGIVSESIKKKDLIEKLLTICNSTLIINADGLLEVCTDKEETNPVALLNSENIISMTWSKSLARKLDGKKVTFTNRDSWTVDTFYSMLDGGSYDYATDQVDSLALDYVTTYNHAYKLAQRKLREIQLMPQTMEVDVGSEGDFYPLYSTVLMQLPQLLQGLRSSVIKHVYYNTSNQITKIDISDAVDFVSGSRYGVVIQAMNDYGFKLISAEVTGTGQTRTLTFSAPLTPDQSLIVPTLGNHLSFGLLDENGGFTKVTHTMKIYGIKPNGKSGYVLTVRNYDPEVYSYGGPIPEYNSNVTKPQNPSRGVSIDDVLNAQRNLRGEMITSINATVENLYANHIVTLYKESDQVLSDTGITSDLIYNFRTNGVSWDGPGSNGWSITMPANPTNQVWVTSATAYGKSVTDSIEPNEWAEPIVMGLNGSNGVNTATIQLYKRSVDAPTLIPATLTYYFADARIVCGDFNGWSTSVPDVREDGNPVWEIHATALSTGASDVIATGGTWEQSGWSTPSKITQDGLTEQDVLDLIGDVQNESPNVYAYPTAGTIAVDSEGIVPVTQTVSMEIRVVQNNEDIDFTFGQITPPSGISVLADGHVLRITAAEGTRLQTSYIDVPVIFRSYRNNDYLVDEDGNPLVWFSCEDQHYYGAISSLSNLPASQSNSWFLWSGNDTQSTPELVEDGVFKKDTYYTYDSKWVKASMIPLGIETEAVEDSRYTVAFTLSPIQGGRYAGPVSSTSNIPASPVINDFFTWTGTDQTSYSGVQYGVLLTGCCYKWTGTQWVKDTGDLHRAVAMKDLLSVAEAKLAANNSDIISMVRELIAWNVVTENIQVTGEALIDSAIVNNLTIGKQSEQTGSIASWNFDSTHGFKLDVDGKLYAREAVISGDITAKSFILGENATITKGTDQSGSSYFGLAANGALKVRNINALSGNFTGNITANSFTLGANATITKGTDQSGHSYFGLAADGTLKVRDGLFQGVVQSENFQLGVSGYKLTSDGYSFMNSCLFAHDLELPVLTNWVNDIQDVSIDMDTESSSTIKNKLDALIDSYGIPTYTSDPNDKYVYANIVSTDPSNVYANYISALGVKEKMCHYLCRYTSNNKIYYVIGNKEQVSIISIERVLIMVQDGVPYKNISNDGSSKLLINTISESSECYGHIYSREYIQARKGYLVRKRGKLDGSDSQISKRGELFDLLNRVLTQTEAGRDGITLWIEEEDNYGTLFREAAICTYKDSTKQMIMLYSDSHPYGAQFVQGSTEATPIRYIYI